MKLMNQILYNQQKINPLILPSSKNNDHLQIYYQEKSIAAFKMEKTSSHILISSIDIFYPEKYHNIIAVIYEFGFKNSIQENLDGKLQLIIETTYLKTLFSAGFKIIAQDDIYEPWRHALQDRPNLQYDAFFKKWQQLKNQTEPEIKELLNLPFYKTAKALALKSLNAQNKIAAFSIQEFLNAMPLLKSINHQLEQSNMPANLPSHLTMYLPDAKISEFKNSFYPAKQQPIHIEQQPKPKIIEQQPKPKIPVSNKPDHNKTKVIDMLNKLTSRIDNFEKKFQTDNQKLNQRLDQVYDKILHLESFLHYKHEHAKETTSYANKNEMAKDLLSQIERKRLPFNNGKHFLY